MPTKQPQVDREAARPVRAVTVRQPKAAAVLARPGPHELPGWQTDYRGPLLIHADRRGAGDPPLVRTGGPTYGAVIGIVDLVDCVEGAGADGDRDEVGYVWVLAHPRPFARPIPHAGKLGLFDIAHRIVADALASAAK